MIKKNDKEIVGVFKGTTEISAVYKGLVLVYQNAKTLIAEGISPLTLLKALDKALLGYRVYGNSTQQLLPDGYTQLEHIESTGTQYINTGITYDNTKDYTIYQDIEGVGTQRTTGSGWNAGGAIFVNLSNKWYDGSNDGTINVSANERVKLTIDIAKGTDTLTTYNWYFVDSQTTTTTTRSHASLGTYSSNTGYPLFTSTQGGGSIGSQFNMSAKLYGASIVIDDTLVRNLIPAKNSSNVIGMYDTVNGVFYQNAGTGTFTAGPVAPTPNAPIEIESVGTHTNNYFDTKKVSRFNYDITVENDSISISGGYQTIVNFKPYDLKPNTTYTMKYHLSRTQASSTVQGRVRFAKSDNSTSIVVINNSDASSLELDLIGTFTTPSDIREYIRMWFYSGTGTTEFKNIQVVEGTYTLQTMPAYESYGYNIPVTVSGKNICNPNSFINTKKLLDGVNGNLNSNNNYKTTDFIFIKAGTYTLSLDNTYDGTSSTTTRMCLYDTNYGYTGNAVSDTSVRPTRPSYTFTVSNDCYYRLSVRNTDEKVMIEKKDSVTSYEPYVAPTTTNIYLREPLRKLGNYADYIDFETQKVYRNIQQNYYDGISSGQVINFISRVYDDYVRFVAGSFSPANVWSLNVEKCNYLPYNTNQTPDCLTVGGNSGPSLFLYNTTVGITADDDTNAKKIAKANAWLQSLSPVLQIAYVLATPTEEIVTLPEITLNKGTNIISVDTSTAPSDVWIKYKGKN